jgi:hypothetical protein
LIRAGVVSAVILVSAVLRSVSSASSSSSSASSSAFIAVSLEDYSTMTGSRLKLSNPVAGMATRRARRRFRAMPGNRDQQQHWRHKARPVVHGINLSQGL